MFDAIPPESAASLDVAIQLNEITEAKRSFHN